MDENVENFALDTFYVDSTVGFTFSNPIEFYGSVFDSIIFFKYSDFTKATFSRTHFKTNACFEYVDFNSKSSFIEAKFDSSVSFRGTFFDSVSYFSRAKFNSDANFSFVRFSSEVWFNQAKFKAVASFHSSLFKSLAQFGSTEFGSVLKMDYIIFRDEGLIDLTTVKFDSSEICHIHLAGTDISRIIMRYGNFRLAFDSTDNVNIREATYLNLRSRLLELNYIEDAETLDKEYQNWKYLEKDSLNVQRITNFIQKNWWGYGYEKQYIIRNSLLIYFVFFLINLFILKRLCSDIYRIDVIYKDFSLKRESLFRRILRRIFHSAFYTGLVFFGVYFNSEKFQNQRGQAFSKNFPLVVYFFFMYCSGLICIGYLANFVLSK